MAASPLCSDISEFLEALKKLRVKDDKIINALNMTLPTESFSKKIDAQSNCKDLYRQIVNLHQQRQSSLNDCLMGAHTQVQRLKNETKSKPDDPFILKDLRKEQTKLREIQRQIDVEKVIRENTLKVYNEKCRTFYKPTSDNSEDI